MTNIRQIEEHSATLAAGVASQETRGSPVYMQFTSARAASCYGGFSGGFSVVSVCVSGNLFVCALKSKSNRRFIYRLIIESLKPYPRRSRTVRLYSKFLCGQGLKRSGLHTFNGITSFTCHLHVHPRVE